MIRQQTRRAGYPDLGPARAQSPAPPTPATICVETTRRGEPYHHRHPTWLTLHIGDSEYHATRLDAGAFGVAAVRLTTGSGDAYDIIRTRDGLIECTCAHYEFRCRMKPSRCKHGAAAEAVGLV